MGCDTVAAAAPCARGFDGWLWKMCVRAGGGGGAAVRRRCMHALTAVRAAATPGWGWGLGV